jgi:hypothetical protein
MERCQTGTNTEECDDRLSSDDLDPNGIGFCNNEDSLQEILRTKY